MPTHIHKYSPLPSDHPLVKDGTKCPGCDAAFQTGDVTTLIAIGPGSDDVERRRARDGKPYNAIAIPAHYACVTGEEP